MTKINKFKFNTQKDKLLLYNLRCKDEFLNTMTRFFHSLRWLGIAGGERIIWKIWGVVLLLFFMTIEIEAIWKVIKALAGWAITLVGSRTVTDRIAGAMFYTSSMLGLLVSWNLVFSWRDLSKYWSSIETTLSIKYVPLDKTMSKRMYGVITVFLFCAITEHILSILISSDFQCPLQLCLRTYILNSHGFLLLEHEYTEWIGVSLVFMSNLATLIWNIQDLIIILISMGLTSRYRRLNQCVATITELNQRDENWFKNIETLKVYTWKKIREEYVKQAKLVRRVDSHLGILILSANFFNLYFICVQLFLWFTRGLQVYHFISFFWLFVRTLSSVLAAADVNTSSKLALPYLYQCTTQVYNIEIRRLQKQLAQDNVALSGMGFYYLDRTLVLQMAAAVFTYVLVLIQYDSGRNQ